MDGLFDPHQFFKFLHILAFVLWLGADLGVYHAARYVADGSLATDERLRFLKLLMALDMYPRSMLILMLPLGFQLASNLALIRVPDGAIALFWLIGLAWFGLMWAVHSAGSTPGGRVLKAIDLGLRWVVLALLLVAGLWSLATGRPITEPWLAIKLICFAGVIGLGLLLRGSVADWMRGFALLATDKPKGDTIIADARLIASRYALTLWGLLVVMGYLGTMKPFIQ
jgi:uncharacterized membrane protein